MTPIHSMAPGGIRSQWIQYTASIIYDLMKQPKKDKYIDWLEAKIKITPLGMLCGVNEKEIEAVLDSFANAKR